jgi:hypothetical protein
MNDKAVSKKQGPVSEDGSTHTIEVKKNLLLVVGIVCAFVLCLATLGGYGIGRNQSVSSSAVENMAAKNKEYNKLKQQIVGKQKDLDIANRVIAESSREESGIDDLKKQHSDLEQQVNDKQAELDGLTQKVDAAKKASISDGTWQVGADIDPGTYRATSEVPSDCYWEVRSNDNIVKNDIPGGGFPQTTVSAGQQLKLNSCGTWAKQ